MYNPSVARWNGVDALAEKYAAWSPYNYTLGNPIKYIDPDGNRIWIYYGDGENDRYEYRDGSLYDNDGNKYTGETTQYVKDVVASFEYLSNSETGQGLISYLESLQGEDKNLNDVYIRQTSIYNEDGSLNEGAMENLYDHETNTVFYDPYAGNDLEELAGETGFQSPALGLLHELGHAQGDLDDPVGYAKRTESDEGSSERYPGLGGAEEKRVTQRYEAPAARELNAFHQSRNSTMREGIRDTHYGNNFRVSGPTSNSAPEDAASKKKRKRRRRR